MGGSYGSDVYPCASSSLRLFRLVCMGLAMTSSELLLGKLSIQPASNFPPTPTTYPSPSRPLIRLLPAHLPLIATYIQPVILQQLVMKRLLKIPQFQLLEIAIKDYILQLYVRSYCTSSAVAERSWLLIISVFQKYHPVVQIRSHIRPCQTTILMVRNQLTSL